MILHLIRHPPPRVAPGVCYGRLDVEAENAPAVAAALRAELPPGLPLWSSPLRRCRELAGLLHPAPRVDARLAEIDFGDWEGRTWDEIPRSQLDAWAADVGGFVPPGGESPRQLQARVLDFVAGLTGPAAALVTHAGVIRVLVAHREGLPPERWCELQFAYGSRTLLDIDRRR